MNLILWRVDNDEVKVDGSAPLERVNITNIYQKNCNIVIYHKSDKD